MICLILARGGSKGVPKKNIKILNGKPLIYYVIYEAKKSKKITKIYVSTDDDEIADIVKEYGVEVIKRPKQLSEDHSLDVDSFRHFCELKNQKDPIVHLRATTPLINHKVIDVAITTYNNTENITSLRSAHETPESVYKFYIKKNNKWKPLVDGMDTNGPRQTYEKTYLPNGYVDIVSPKIFMNQNTFYGDNIYAFETKVTPEIDTIEDFYYIEYILKNKKNV